MMTRAYLAAAALLLGGASATLAGTTGEFDNECVMGLAFGEDIKTDCSVNTEYNGKTYCFGNEQAKQTFMKDPAANLAKAQEFYKSEHKG